jgi:hypothetical protein
VGEEGWEKRDGGKEVRKGMGEKRCDERGK